MTAWHSTRKTRKILRYLTKPANYYGDLQLAENQTLNSMVFCAELKLVLKFHRSGYYQWYGIDSRTFEALMLERALLQGKRSRTTKYSDSESSFLSSASSSES